MTMKDVKDGIEGLSNTVLNFEGVIHGRMATGMLLGDYIEVPYNFEGAFGVPLAHIDLLDCNLEVAEQLLTLPLSEVGLEDAQCTFNSPSSFFALEGILRRFMASARLVLLEHEVRSLKRHFEAFHCFLSIQSVKLHIVCCECL